MSDLFKFLSLAFFASIAMPVFAQETATPETQEPAESEEQTADPEAFPLGNEEGGEPQIGQTYVLEVIDDWQVRCLKLEEGQDPCEMYQLLRDAEQNAVAEINMRSLPEGSPAAAGATVITPLETLLTEQLRLSIDGSPARKYSFTWCSEVGCFSRLGLTANDITALKRGNNGVITIVPVAAPDQKVELAVSLTGFTKAFDRVTELNVPKSE